jgi:hypothetical protein
VRSDGSVKARHTVSSGALNVWTNSMDDESDEICCTSWGRTVTTQAMALENAKTIERDLTSVICEDSAPLFCELTLASLFECKLVRMQACSNRTKRPLTVERFLLQAPIDEQQRE